MGGFWSDLGSVIGGIGLGAASFIPGLGAVAAPAAAGLLTKGIGGMVTDDPAQPKQPPGLMLASKGQDAPKDYLSDTNYIDAIRRLGGA